MSAREESFLCIELTEEEVARYTQAAQAHGMTLEEFLFYGLKRGLDAWLALKEDQT